MDEPDRICQMIRAAVDATATAGGRDGGLPVTVKIRLLDTVEATVDFCRRLCEAGVAGIAIHGRHRASWERTSAGARDGPALLDQVAAVRRALAQEYPRVAVITNGNTVTWTDVEDNLAFTGAHGLMSAEGILDDPALFLPRYTNKKVIKVWSLEPTPKQQARIDKLQKKLKRDAEPTASTENNNNKNDSTHQNHTDNKIHPKTESRMRKLQTLRAATLRHTEVTLESLQATARDKLALCHEYLDWVEASPSVVPMRTAIFHTRRMCRDLLVQYQLLEACLRAPTVVHLRRLLDQMRHYRAHPEAFVYDRQKAQLEKEALARQKAEEGRRQAYEARMIRKAKREHRTDPHYYLKQGAAVPTAAQLQEYRRLAAREELLAVWKRQHGQHCLAHHLDEAGCPRGPRKCAFLHVDVVRAADDGSSNNKNVFVERDEVAG